MSWTRDATTGIITHAGTVREVWRATQALFTKTQISVGFTTTAHNIKVAVRLSGDTRTRFTCGIEGANIVIQRWTLGVLVTTHATAAHTIAAGTPGVLRVRLQGDTIECSVVPSSTSTVTISHTTTDLRGSQRWGVESDVNGAIASYLSVAELTDRVSTVTDVAVSVIGGAVFASYAPGSWELIQGGVFDAGTKVSTAVVDGKVWMIGGGRARVFDPVTRLVTDWTATPGSLPGYTTAGTTTARLLWVHQGCLIIAGMPEAPITIYKAKLGDPLNLDTGERLFGSAAVFGVGSNATVPDPILGFHDGPDGTLCVTCTNSVNFIVGDLNAGLGTILTKSNTTGGSGDRCMTKAYTGNGGEIVVMHGPEGLHVVPVGGAPAPLSAPILRKYLEYPREIRSLRTVVVARDPERAMLHAFIDDGATSSVHVAYAERVGRYVPGSPGFYPMTLPVRITCAAIVRGVLVLGTTDGRLVAFDTDATTDLGSAMTSKLTTALVDAQEDIEDDTIIRRVHAVCGDDCSELTANFYGAVSPESAYTGTRRLLATRTLGPGQRARTMLARAPFIVVEIVSTGVVVVERFQIEYDTARLSRTGVYVDVAAPGAPCSYPTATAPASPAPSGGGPGTRPTTSPPPPPPPPFEPPVYKQFPGGGGISVEFRSQGEGPFGEDLLGIIGDPFGITDTLTLQGLPFPYSPDNDPFTTSITRFHIDIDPPPFIPDGTVDEDAIPTVE